MSSTAGSTNVFAACSISGLLRRFGSLLEQGIPPSAKPFEAIGYRHVLRHLDSSVSTGRNHSYNSARHQTLRKASNDMVSQDELNVTWFDGPGDSEEIKNKVRQFVEPILSVGPTGQPI